MATLTLPMPKPITTALSTLASIASYPAKVLTSPFQIKDGLVAGALARENLQRGLKTVSKSNYAEVILANDTDYLATYVHSLWIYAAVRTISREAAPIPFKILSKSSPNAKPKQLFDGACARIFEFVNPYIGPHKLWEATISYLKLTGNSYWEIVRDPAGTPIELWPLRPDRMYIVPGDPKKDQPFILGYIYRSNTTKDIPLLARQVFHIKYFNPFSDFYGQSPLQAAIDSIIIDRYIQANNKNLLKNEAVPRGALKTPRRLDDDAYARLEKSWEARHGGPEHAGRIAILENGLEYERIELTPQELNYLQMKEVNREELFGIFGLTPMMVGLARNATFASSREQRKMFMEDVLLPELSFLAEEVNSNFIEPNFTKPGDKTKIFGFFDTSNVPALRENEEIRARIDQMEVRNGIRTINQVREKRGEHKVPWGDTWWIPERMVPVEFLQDLAKEQIPNGKDTNGKESGNSTETDNGNGKDTNKAVLDYIQKYLHQKSPPILVSDIDETTYENLNTSLLSLLNELKTHIVSNIQEIDDFMVFKDDDAFIENLLFDYDSFIDKFYKESQTILSDLLSSINLNSSSIIDQEAYKFSTEINLKVLSQLRGQLRTLYSQDQFDKSELITFINSLFDSLSQFISNFTYSFIEKAKIYHSEEMSNENNE